MLNYLKVERSWEKDLKGANSCQERQNSWLKSKNKVKRIKRKEQSLKGKLGI